jgi:hypothetical protein
VPRTAVDVVRAVAARVDDVVAVVAGEVVVTVVAAQVVIALAAVQVVVALAPVSWSSPPRR